jgi:hypothetical protein
LSDIVCLYEVLDLPKKEMKKVQVTVLIEKTPKTLKGKKRKNFFKKWNKKLMEFVEESQKNI